MANLKTADEMEREHTNHGSRLVISLGMKPDSEWFVAYAEKYVKKEELIGCLEEFLVALQAQRGVDEIKTELLRKKK